MFKGRISCTHHATDATWSKWVTLITQQPRIGNPSHLGILEVIMDWSEDKDFEMSPEEEAIRAEEAPLYNKLPEARSNMPCLLMHPAVLWKKIGDGKQLYGAPYYKSQKLLKEKAHYKFATPPEGEDALPLRGWCKMTAPPEEKGTFPPRGRDSMAARAEERGSFPVPGVNKMALPL
ncbi:hypothetical protein BTVI_44348 [Pitangus sulphuratus]|nr:hypothetical protein BTVI_44348 [Pitangus sulphuratus]